jgi:hypothetical protein
VTAKRTGRFWEVKAILDLFVQMGCELRVAESDPRSDTGEISNLRYLFNPQSGNFVAIVDLGDDEFVSAGEVAFWERRLGVTIPKPP